MSLELRPRQTEAEPDNSVDLLESRFTANLQGASKWRKFMIVFSTSWITMSACFSSTLFLSTVNEITNEFGVPQETLEVANGGVLLTFGMSTFMWGPVEQLCGRQTAYNSCIVALLALTIATVLTPNVEAFITVRILSGLQGTYFHVAAQTIFAEYFPPSQRGTATGCFLAGVVLGSPLGPLVGAVIVTYKSWRVILWLQSAMVAFGLALSVTFIQFGRIKTEKPGERLSIPTILRSFNPIHVLRWLKYPNVLLTNIACGLLSWPQFSLLTVPRLIIDRRFQLDTPILSGLFYLAPATGFVVGTIAGGRLSDTTVKRWIEKRNGLRLPEDRLRAGIFSFFIIIPSAYLGFGWGMDCINCSRVNLVVPAITAFFVGAGIFDAMTGINSYCSEVLPQGRRDVIASKYLIQYTFSAISSGVAVPLIDAVGLGRACTIDVILVIVSAISVTIVARHGSAMQRWGDGGPKTEVTSTI